jgi:hypothetical protein
MKVLIRPSLNQNIKVYLSMVLLPVYLSFIMKRPTFYSIMLLLSIVIVFASCVTTGKSCNVSKNKKKFNYYNGLQYRGARKN